MYGRSKAWGDNEPLSFSICDYRLELTALHFQSSVWDARHWTDLCFSIAFECAKFFQIMRASQRHRRFDSSFSWTASKNVSLSHCSPFLLHDASTVWTSIHYDKRCYSFNLMRARLFFNHNDSILLQQFSWQNVSLVRKRAWVRVPSGALDTLIKHRWRCAGFVNPREEFKSLVQLQGDFIEQC